MLSRTGSCVKKNTDQKKKNTQTGQINVLGWIHVAHKLYFKDRCSSPTMPILYGTIYFLFIDVSELLECHGI